MIATTLIVGVVVLGLAIQYVQYTRHKNRNQVTIYGAGTPTPDDSASKGERSTESMQ